MRHEPLNKNARTQSAPLASSEVGWGLGREGDLNCEVAFLAGAASAEPHCSARPQTLPNPLQRHMDELRSH